MHVTSTKTIVEAKTKTSFEKLTTAQIAEVFVLASFLASATAAVLEQRWVMTHHEAPYLKDFESFLTSIFETDLLPIAFLSELFSDAHVATLERVQRAACLIAQEAVRYMTPAKIEQPDAGPLPDSGVPAFPSAIHAFARQSLILIRDLVRLESTRRPEQIRKYALFASRMENLKEGLPTELKWPSNRPLPAECSLFHTMYRAFDAMDEVLAISYEKDIGMSRPAGSQERLYEGAGLGVQSSFTTIIVALEALDLPNNGSLIDLGSGYGRVGLVVGLLRPDIKFTGFEYVDHRVLVSRASAERCGVAAHVHFETQDLSSLDFKIPEADAYYLFDPFRKETYEHVFSQIVAIGRNKEVAVLTKGHAGSWFAEASLGENWVMSEAFDEGTLLIFRSFLN